ncbi:MAG: KTSC domain-containing protein [Clostridiales bacterium]|nr:KTSC domain-containing protein [Clostridiales bacterium]
MQRYPVLSSRIANIGWENDTLEVQFHNGAVYQYYNVSHSEYQNFMNASSLGSELSRLDKIHSYRRII